MCACKSVCECECVCVPGHGDVLATGLIMDVVGVISSLPHRIARYVIDHGEIGTHVDKYGRRQQLYFYLIVV